MSDQADKKETHQEKEARLLEKIEKIKEEQQELKNSIGREQKETEINQMVEQILRDNNAINPSQLVEHFRRQHTVKCEEDGEIMIYEQSEDIPTYKTLREAVETWINDTCPEYKLDYKHPQRQRPSSQKTQDDLFIENMTQRDLEKLSPEQRERVLSRVRKGLKSGEYQAGYDPDVS